jgi:hypothetical protein
MPARNWITHTLKEPHAASHGSMHDYDREVPVLMISPGRTPHAAHAAPSQASIYMVRVATLLARWLGVTPPPLLPR